MNILRKHTLNGEGGNLVFIEPAHLTMVTEYVTPLFFPVLEHINL